MEVGNTNLTSAGSSDILIIKLDASGNPLYAKSFGGTSSNGGLGIAVDASGNSCTTGYSFSDTMKVGNTNLTSAGGSEDIFIIKLEASGNPLYAKSFGGTSTDDGTGITMDASGNSYTTGSFQGTMEVGNTNLTSAGGSEDMFIIKLDASGNPLYAKSFGGRTSSDYGVGYDIAVDASGNSYTTGYFSGTMEVGNTNLISAGVYDVFISKLGDASLDPLHLKIKASARKSAIVGKTIKYKISYKNMDPFSTDLTMGLQLPEGFKLAQFSAKAKVVTTPSVDSNGLLIWKTPLQSGKTETLTLTLKVTSDESAPSALLKPYFHAPSFARRRGLTTTVQVRVVKAFTTA